MNVVANARKRNTFKIVQMQSRTFLDLIAISQRIVNRKIQEEIK